MKETVLVASLIFAVAGCSAPNAKSQAESSQHAAASPTVTQDLANYSQTVVAAAGGNIFKPTPAARTGDKPMMSYVVKFHTSDPGLMAQQDGDNNKVSVALNGALQEAWSRRFCTPELRSIMVEHDVFLVSGHLLDADGKMQVFTSCMRDGDGVH